MTFIHPLSAGQPVHSDNSATQHPDKGPMLAKHTPAPKEADPRGHFEEPTVGPINEAAFTAVEMEQMVAVTIDVNPYLAPHMQKGKRWEEVAKRLRLQDLCMRSTGKTIKNKVEALLKHHEVSVDVSDIDPMLTALYRRNVKKSNPNSVITKTLRKNPSVEARMPALLDRLTGLKAQAQNVKENQADNVRKVRRIKQQTMQHS